MTIKAAPIVMILFCFHFSGIPNMIIKKKNKYLVTGDWSQTIMCRASS